MANEEQVKVLKQGWRVWNKWREENIGVKIDLRGVSLFRVYLSGVDLKEVDLREADLREANLNDAELRRADLSGANLIGASLREVDLREGNLGGSNLEDAELRDARLSGANLGSANLFWTDLRAVDLRSANLSEANLGSANLWAAQLDRANFERARIGFTIFGNVDLSNVSGLETIVHEDPSTIGIDTLEKSGGNIPIAFLRGAGVSENLITYARSLVTNPIQYFTCFISYSSKDYLFVERLYADLQNRGVRCWLDREDLKIGDKWRDRIDEAIRMYDKLLLVLSSNSVASEWVEREVEAAFEKERRTNKLVLFPIRLDDAVMKVDVAWAGDIRRRRHVGDFTTWLDPIQYRNSFDRLVRDLQGTKDRKE